MNPALLQKGSNSFRTDSEIKDHEGLDIMFVASSCEPLPSLFKLCLWQPKMASPRMSHVLFVEVLHPVNLSA